MKPSQLAQRGLAVAALLAAFAALPALRADDHHDHAEEMKMEKMAPPADEAAWIAHAKKLYPLEVCVVSDEPLAGGGMGGPIDYVYKEEGKPDRLVRFCCKDCVRSFKKDPAKYLAKIDAALATKAGKMH